MFRTKSIAKQSKRFVNLMQRRPIIIKEWRYYGRTFDLIGNSINTAKRISVTQEAEARAPGMPEGRDENDRPQGPLRTPIEPGPQFDRIGPGVDVARGSDARCLHIRTTAGLKPRGHDFMFGRRAAEAVCRGDENVSFGVALEHMMEHRLANETRGVESPSQPLVESQPFRNDDNGRVGVVRAHASAVLVPMSGQRLEQAQDALFHRLLVEGVSGNRLGLLAGYEPIIGTDQDFDIA